MYRLDVIKHCDASASVIERVINIKSVAWPYPKDSQLEWIKNNLEDDDLHVYLMEDDIDVAYLNMVNVEAIIDGKTVRCKGIGNVCARFPRSGKGSDLLQHTMKMILANEWNAILFCRDKVVDFYKKNNWRLVPHENVTINNSDCTINLLTYNIGQISQFHYSDRPF